MRFSLYLLTLTVEWNDVDGLLTKAGNSSAV